MTIPNTLSPPLSATLADILSWSPCFSLAEILDLARLFGKDQITTLEALDLPLSAENRLWLVLRPKLVPRPVLHEFACQCAEYALDLIQREGKPINPRSLQGVQTKRAWLQGEASEDALSQARTAAWTASRAPGDRTHSDSALRCATTAAAYATTGDNSPTGARNASRGSSTSAACTAAWIAYRTAESNPAWDIAHEESLQTFIRLLRSLLSP